MEFTDYAGIWWDQLVKNRRRNGEPPIRTWENMKALMRKRYVPSYYYRDLCRKLQSLTQGFRSVEDYYKEMEVSMMRANIIEDEEATMARFIGGLNQEVAGIVDLQNYMDMEELLHKAIKIERQLKAKRSAKGGSTSNNTWKSSWKNEKPNPREDFKGKPATTNVMPQKGKTDAPTTTRTREIKCFRCQGFGHIASNCPNKRAMILLDNGDVESVSSSDNEMPPLEDCSDIDVEEPVKGDLLVTRRALSVQVKEDHDKEQRENIFHTRCHVNNKVCSLIIDSGSCTNVASTLLVHKLNLKIERHLKPYKLQWLSDCGEIKVTKQVSIALSIGKYKDRVLCDVVPMQATHIFLGWALAI